MHAIVICSNFQSEAISRAIESAAKQTISPRAIIIVNDSGTDLSAGFLEDSNIDYVINNTVNIGFTKSLNKAFEFLLDKFGNKLLSISLLDDDDEWIDEEKLDKQWRFLVHNPGVDVVATRFDIVDQNGGILRSGESGYFGPVSRQILSLGNVVCHPTVMFNADFLRNSKLRYNELLERSQDFEFWLRILKYRGDGAIVVLEDVCANHTYDDTVIKKIKKRYKDLQSNKKIIALHPDLKLYIPASILSLFNRRRT